MGKLDYNYHTCDIGLLEFRVVGSENHSQPGEDQGVINCVKNT
jgi:hypothetical protein